MPAADASKASACIFLYLVNQTCIAAKGYLIIGRRKRPSLQGMTHSTLSMTFLDLKNRSDKNKMSVE